MRDRITAALKDHGAEYVEIRLEQSESAHLRYRGRDIEEVGRTSGIGGNVRALAGGGWGFACFNDLSQLKEKVATAVSHARHVGGEQVSLAEIEPHVDIVPYDPKLVSLSEKKSILDEYAEIMLGVSGVQTCTIGYGDSRRKTAFATSEGAYIEQERVDVVLRLTAMARDGGEVQQAGVSLGSSGDFSFVRSLHQQAQELGQRAMELLRAPKVKGGEYTVILDPILAGVFIHEAFGHLS